MNNKKFIILMVIIVLLIIGTILLFTREESDAKAFKKEYKNIEVSKNNPIMYLTDEELITALSTNDKLIFLGSNDSKQTLTAVPILLKAAEDHNIDRIYYYNTENINENSDAFRELALKLNRKTFGFPILALVKNGAIETFYEGVERQDELYEEYENIMIDYTMCSEDC